MAHGPRWWRGFWQCYQASIICLHNWCTIQIIFQQHEIVQWCELSAFFRVSCHRCSFGNNKKLFQLITSLWEQVHRFRVTYVSNYEASLSLVEEHNRILQAIKNGDSDLAKKYATEHIEIAEQFFMNNTVNS